MHRKITELFTKKKKKIYRLYSVNIFSLTTAAINELVHDVKQLFPTKSTSLCECFLNISMCRGICCHTRSHSELPVVFHNSGGDSSEWLEVDSTFPPSVKVKIPL